MTSGSMTITDTYIVRPIGVVRSPLRRLSDAPRQGNEDAPNARLEIEPAFARGLKEIRQGAEIIVITWLHEAHREVLAVYPRDDLSNPLTGVFATRSADRPNPIGLHRVRVLKVHQDGSLEVEGLEAIDGTPIVDLKPVLADARDS